MLKVKLLTKKGFVPPKADKTLKALKLSLPGALWKGGEANYEQAT